MTWYSQAGQDKWVSEQMRALTGRSTGWFVDVGAYDGISTSNTYALEQAGWQGLCVEPGPSFEQLKMNRSCAVTRQAASNFTGGVRFDGMSVIADDGAPVHGESYVPCATLDYLMDSAGIPHVVDYLSIDVEGHEPEVLDGINFARRHFRFITIEHNAYRDGPALKTAIHDHLTAAGFIRAVDNAGCVDPCPPPAYPGCPFEDWYINRTVRRT